MDDVGVGDPNSTERGSAARRNRGKPTWHQIPMHLLAGVARVLMAGELKYRKFNWVHGMSWSVCFDCTMNHLFKWWYCREDVDDETLEHHIDHAICNLLFLKHYLTYYPDGDDRPEWFEEQVEEIRRRFDYDACAERLGVDAGGDSEGAAALQVLVSRQSLSRDDQRVLDELLERWRPRSESLQAIYDPLMGSGNVAYTLLLPGELIGAARRDFESLACSVEVLPPAHARARGDS